MVRLPVCSSIVLQSPHVQKYNPFAYNLTEKSKSYKSILREREVTADFCYQTGPLTQLKEVKQTLTKHSMGITIIRGGVHIPVYKTHYISEKGGGI